MKNNFRIISIIAFVIAVPTLIITDWYYSGYGILVFFFCATIGLIFDQVVRLKYPTSNVFPIENYRTNKILNIISLVFFVQSPVGLIYGNRFYNTLGFWIFAIMICIGVSFNRIATIKFHYTKKCTEENL